jgi:two-component system cell cycle response regulator CtrA
MSTTQEGRAARATLNRQALRWADIEAMRDRIDELEETVRQLRDVLVPTVRLPPVIGLSRGEDRIVRCILACAPGIATFERVWMAQDGDAEHAQNDSSRRVMVCNARRKMKPFGIDIGTVWGVGYRMSGHHADALRRMMADAELGDGR